MHGFAASMSEQDRPSGSPPTRPSTFVQQNQTVKLVADQPNPPSWGLDRVDQRDLPLDNNYSYATTASNVHAYIIDTGVETTHSEFGGRATSGFDAVDNDNDATDCNGHGTHVAGTVGGSTYGLAKEVRPGRGPGAELLAAPARPQRSSPASTGSPRTRSSRPWPT